MKKKIFMLAIGIALSTATLMAHNANGESCCKTKDKAKTESCCKAKANQKDEAKSGETKECKNAGKCSKCPKKNASQQPAPQEAPAKK